MVYCTAILCTGAHHWGVWVDWYWQGARAGPGHGLLADLAGTLERLHCSFIYFTEVVALFIKAYFSLDKYKIIYYSAHSGNGPRERRTTLKCKFRLVLALKLFISPGCPANNWGKVHSGKYIVQSALILWCWWLLLELKRTITDM